MKLNKQISNFFAKNGLSLTEKGQSISRKDKGKLNELRALIPAFEQERRVFIKCTCQSSIDDFIVLLQKYVKDNPLPVKASANVTEQPDSKV